MVKTIIIIPKGVLEGFHNVWIDSYYKNASLSIGGWKIVIKNCFVYNFLRIRAHKLPLLVQNFVAIKLNIYNFY